jgi:integrator complex subunit 8
MGHYSSAMKWYLEAIVIVSDYFARPVLKPMIEDYVYKRMMKCCMQMQNFTQVIIFKTIQIFKPYNILFLFFVGSNIMSIPRRNRLCNCV